MLSLDLPLHSFRPFLLLELFHFDGDDDKKDGDESKLIFLAVKNDLRQTSHARRWCPIIPIHLDEVKFAFFGFCPSSFQSCSERQ